MERRPLDYVVRIVDQMEDSQIVKGRGRPRKSIRETIRKNLENNELESGMMYGSRTLWRCLIQVADPT